MKNELLLYATTWMNLSQIVLKKPDTKGIYYGYILRNSVYVQFKTRQN